jgi:hypothetical protein
MSGSGQMKFFLPVAEDAKIAEESYQAIKKFIEKQTGWRISDTRYYEIHYRHNDPDLYARVGGPDPLNGEKVFAIFKPKKVVPPKSRSNRPLRLNGQSYRTRH